MVTIGNIIAPISESCGSCNRFENNATAHINPKTDDSAKNPLSLLNGRLAAIRQIPRNAGQEEPTQNA